MRQNVVLWVPCPPMSIGTSILLKRLLTPSHWATMAKNQQWNSGSQSACNRICPPVTLVQNAHFAQFLYVSGLIDETFAIESGLFSIHVASFLQGLTSFCCVEASFIRTEALQKNLEAPFFQAEPLNFQTDPPFFHAVALFLGASGAWGASTFS